MAEQPTPIDRHPLFAQCNACGERWKIATLPLPLSKFGYLKPCCPNCMETKNIALCATEGEHAVTEPREGKELR